MKAIAIVEVLDGGKGQWYIDGDIHYTEDESLMKKFDAEMIPLKPMPKPKGYINAIEWHLTEKDSAMFISGWNNCLEELEK